MGILFFPLGSPFSSSIAVNCGYTENTSVGGFPTTASVAQYVVNYVGPVGAAYTTVSALRVE